MNPAATASSSLKSPVRSSVTSARCQRFQRDRLQDRQGESREDLEENRRAGARPHSERFRCGGRESTFRAARRMSLRQKDEAQELVRTLSETARP